VELKTEAGDDPTTLQLSNRSRDSYYRS